MPILDVEIVFPPGEKVPEGLAAALADAAAEVFGPPKGSTWVRLHELPADHYAENGGEAGARPVFVRVLKLHLPAEDELEREAAGLAAAIGLVCDRPAENVHIIYEPLAAGRVAFGGKLVRKD